MSFRVKCCLLLLCPIWLWTNSESKLIKTNCSHLLTSSCLFSFTGLFTETNCDCVCDTTCYFYQPRCDTWCVSVCVTWCRCLRPCPHSSISLDHRPTTGISYSLKYSDPSLWIHAVFRCVLIVATPAATQLQQKSVTPCAPTHFSFPRFWHCSMLILQQTRHSVWYLDCFGFN